MEISLLSTTRCSCWCYRTWYAPLGSKFSSSNDVLHTLRVFFTGSYKQPRELNWVVGVLIFFVMLGLSFTGYLLPWDMKALFATKVGLQIAESVPIIGPWVKTLLAGDAEIVGAQTLTRFFAIHVFFLPAALFALLAAHFIMIRKQGISGPL